MEVVKDVEKKAVRNQHNPQLIFVYVMVVVNDVRLLDVKKLLEEKLCCVCLIIGLPQVLLQVLQV
eukprot:CAMPEP_0178954720 /NCGR_PEP_ID=MMETSP0789-20121207/9163_1 /TAXON_ID=3005 /ORGANISM="Rhizosolenia setigera, Strain CCMP 1694" /LENGTH=64 /DNA_ID=CAMNT_0020636185 /DNA_START=1122 /DNA_END=1316 /DNA_ORIENTATION=+